MARTNATEVAAIMDTTLSGSDLDPFITAANVVVDAELQGSSALSTTELNEIERWLAAHFAAAKDPAMVRQAVEGSSERYQNRLLVGLFSTDYGQRAALLDETGTLTSKASQQAQTGGGGSGGTSFKYSVGEA